nr:hypothetical protein [Tanacetum cinerariifolium]
MTTVFAPIKRTKNNIIENFRTIRGFIVKNGPVSESTNVPPRNIKNTFQKRFRLRGEPDRRKPREPIMERKPTICVESGTLVGQGSAVIVTVNVDTLSQVTYGSGEYLSVFALLYPGRASYPTVIASAYFESYPLVDVVGYTCHHLVTFCFYYAKEMDLFAFIHHADPTKDDRNDNVNEEGNDAVEAGHTEQGDHVFDVGGIDIVADDEIQAIVVDQPKRVRKKRLAADGTGGSSLPPKKLKEDYGNSGDAGASVAKKLLAASQGLLDSSTLAADIEVTAAATHYYKNEVKVYSV